MSEQPNHRPDVGPPTRTICQIDNCMQHAVADIGGVNVCADHREWKRGKAEPTRVLTAAEGPFPLSEPRLSWEAAIARDIARREVPHGPSLWLLHELRTYLDTLTITGDTIGDIRRACFLPWDSQWNGIVREETAKREGRGVGVSVPPAPAQPPTSTLGPQARAGARHVSDLTRSELVRGLAECITRVENAERYGSRSYVSEVQGLLVAARAARVALDMPPLLELRLQPPIDAVVRQILCEFIGFLSGDVPELNSVEVPRLAESLDRFLRALAK